MVGEGLITTEVEPFIVAVRGQRAILAADLARIYGVETRVLNQAVKRNQARFPPDFVFQLTRDESAEVQRLRSQPVMLGPGQHLKHLPYAFTEHGAIMAATVLNSPRAVEMSVFVVRAFVRLRELLATHKELAAKLTELERHLTTHDEQILAIVDAIRQLAAAPPEKPSRRRIGFQAGEGPGVYRVRRRKSP
jgi:hypothetical protein